MAKGRRITFPKRGEIYQVRFDPTLGAEIKKTRPALILQTDLFNQYSPLTLVAPITSQIKGPTLVTKILVSAGEGGLTADSVVLLNQIRSIDKLRLIKRLGTLTPETMEQIEYGLQVIFGMIKL